MSCGSLASSANFRTSKLRKSFVLSGEEKKRNTKRKFKEKLRDKLRRIKRRSRKCRSKKEPKKGKEKRPLGKEVIERRDEVVHHFRLAIHCAAFKAAF